MITVFISLVFRYVAEVQASAMAVEELAREGRLDLQRNITEEVEEWDEEEEEQEAEVEEGEEEEEVVVEQPVVADDCDTETVKVELEKVEEDWCNVDPMEDRASHQEEGEEDGVLRRRRGQEVLQEVRVSLQEVQEEASSLLREIHRPEEQEEH